ncbi:hypothetical protein HDU97_007034 [Phlyctochytrium planicorne]|nr:hypothetical protein HDU97_007034 [Phlyctochytrium planicorne]
MVILCIGSVAVLTSSVLGEDIDWTSIAVEASTSPLLQQTDVNTAASSTTITPIPRVPELSKPILSSETTSSTSKPGIKASIPIDEANSSVDALKEDIQLPDSGLQSDMAKERVIIAVAAENSAKAPVKEKPLTSAKAKKFEDLSIEEPILTAKTLKAEQTGLIPESGPDRPVSDEEAIFSNLYTPMGISLEGVKEKEGKNVTTKAKAPEVTETPVEIFDKPDTVQTEVVSSTVPVSSSAPPVSQSTTATAEPIPTASPTQAAEPPSPFKEPEDVPPQQQEKTAETRDEANASFEANLDAANPLIKNLKERFNYASFDCGALILSVSPGASSASSILFGNKDQYMLSKCSSSNSRSERFVTIELCDNILVDVIALANFEYFSSNFKEFRILVSEKYAQAANWKVLGNFHASNVRGIQYFSVKNPLIFARYMRIEFISHYGNEFYCPLTLVRVYGTTEMEAFKAEEEELAKANAVEQEEAIKAVAAVAAVAKESVRNLGGYFWTASKYLAHQGSNRRHQLYPEIDGSPSPVQQPHFDFPKLEFFKEDEPVEVATPSPIFAEGVETIPATKKEENRPVAESTFNKQSSWVLSPDYFREVMASEPFPADISGPIINNNNNAVSGTANQPTESTMLTMPTVATPNIPLSEKSPPVQPGNSASSSPQATPLSPSNQSGSSGSPGTSAGTTQESIFKTIAKRLSLLERNATLSYKYIEETSRAYHEAFSRVELASAETVRLTLMECNRTTLKIARDLSRDYETSFRVLLRDLERDKMQSESKFRDLSSSLDRIEEQMKRHIYTEVFLITTIVLLAIRVFFQSIWSQQGGREYQGVGFSSPLSFRRQRGSSGSRSQPLPSNIVVSPTNPGMANTSNTQPFVSGASKGSLSNRRFGKMKERPATVVFKGASASYQDSGDRNRQEVSPWSQDESGNVWKRPGDDTKRTSLWWWIGKGSNENLNVKPADVFGSPAASQVVLGQTNTENASTTPPEMDSPTLATGTLSSPP